MLVEKVEFYLRFFVDVMCFIYYILGVVMYLKLMFVDRCKIMW